MCTREHLEREGYAVCNSALDPSTVDQLVSAIEQACPTDYALRDLFNVVPMTQTLLCDPWVSSFLSDSFFAVRALFFDKVPGKNWPVAWHQDTTIAVKHRGAAGGFGPWSTKAGVPHTRAPRTVLEEMVTLRFHLDDCFADNGALRVAAKSHRTGLIDSDQVITVRENAAIKTCEVAAGGVVAMKPLTLHASSPAHVPSHRRVIHLEFAHEPLPHPLYWNECWSVSV